MEKDGLHAHDENNHNDDHEEEIDQFDSTQGNMTNNSISTTPNQVKDIRRKSEQVLMRKGTTKTIVIEESDTLFCISVDGSVHSEYAFDMIASDFLNTTSKLLVVHIFNSKMDDLYNYNNKKETIVSKYNLKLNQFNLGNVANFILEDRVAKLHALEQVQKISTTFGSDFFISGYYGFKGPKGDNKELSKGVDYLLGYINIPCLIVKEPSLRSEKQNGGYNWLFVFDKQYANAIKCLKKFLPLIHKYKDTVYGIGLYPNYMAYDDIEKDFKDVIDQEGIMNFEYEPVTYNKPVSTIISDRVNFGNIRFDFVIFYNNPDKHRSNPQGSDSVQMVLRCNANIGFING